MVGVSPEVQGLQLVFYHHDLVGGNDSGQAALTLHLLANRVPHNPTWNRHSSAGIVTSCYC